MTFQPLFTPSVHFIVHFLRFDSPIVGVLYPYSLNLKYWSLFSQPT